MSSISLPSPPTTPRRCSSSARAADPRWDPPSEPGAVGSLVQMLEALPLAIELAATRVRTMSLSALTARMGQRFELLTSAGGRPSRHATLRATLDDSWELLSEPERAALAQLSVFDGGFTLQAAEQVLDVGGSWTPDLVRGLVDKSLVRFAATVADRFELLMSVREYAGECLRKDGSGPAELRHGAWFARVGSDGLTTADPGPALAPELANLTIACRRAIARGDTACASATLRATWAVIDARGPFSFALSLAEEAIATAGRDDPVAQLVYANALLALGRTAEALGAYTTALALAETGVDRASIAAIRTEYGVGLMGSSRLDEARAAFETALAEARSVSARRTEGTLHLRLGSVCRAAEQNEAARAHFEEGRAIARSVGDRRLENVALRNLGLVFHEGLGRANEARGYYAEALAMARARGDRRIEGNVLSALGALDHATGHFTEAATWYQAAIALHRQLGNRREEAMVIGNLATLAIHLGRPDEARSRYEAALVIHREVGNRPHEGCVLHYLALLWAERDPARAEAGILEALAIHREVGDRRFEGIVHDSLAALRRRAGELGAARAELATALAIHREVGNVADQARTLTQLGRVALALGEPQAAAEAVAEGLALVRESEDRATLVWLLVLRAELDHGAGRSREGRAGLVEATGLAEGLPDAELHEALTRTRRLLSGA